MGKFINYLLLSAVLIIVISAFAYAEEPKADSVKIGVWKKSLNISLNLNQSSFSNNWVGGDAGNLSWVGLVNGTFERQTSPTFNFRNISILQFGQISSQDKDTKKWTRPRKSTDKIDLDNLGRFTLHAFVDPFVGLRLQSEFLDASYTPKQRLFNPILLTESAGVARMIYQKGKNQVLTRIGFAVRENINNAIVDTATGETKYLNPTDGGLEWVTDVNYLLGSKISYIGRLSILKTFFNSQKNQLKGTPQANYWKTVDFDLESTLNASLTKIIAMTFYAQLIYDKQISLGGRFEEILGLGVTYKLY